MELKQVCSYGACSSLLLVGLSDYAYSGKDMSSYEGPGGFNNFTKDLEVCIKSFIYEWNEEADDLNAERLSDFAFIVVSLNMTMPKAIEHLTALGFQSTGVHNTRKTQQDVLLMTVSTSDLVASMKALGYTKVDHKHSWS